MARRRDSYGEEVAEMGDGGEGILPNWLAG